MAEAKSREALHGQIEVETRAALPGDRSVRSVGCGRICTSACSSIISRTSRASRPAPSKRTSGSSWARRCSAGSAGSPDRGPSRASRRWRGRKRDAGRRAEWVDQLGRFAAQYRRQFGEAPSATLRRARSGVPEAVDDEALRLTWAVLPACFAVAPRQCNAALAKLEHAQRLGAVVRTREVTRRLVPQPARGAALRRRARRSRPGDRARPGGLRIVGVGSAVAGDFERRVHARAPRLDEADRLLERALALDPTSAIAWLRRGWLSVYYGNADLAIRELRVALQMMPFEPVRHLAFIGIGFAHFTAERYADAARWVQTGVDVSPGCYWAERVVVAAAIHAKARPEARRAARRRPRKDPALTVGVAEKAWPFPAQVVERLGQGWPPAGIPKS